MFGMDLVVVWVEFRWHLGGVWIGVWVVGFRSNGCDFF